MGNSSSNNLTESFDQSKLWGEVINNEMCMFNVSTLNTNQETYKKYKIIKYSCKNGSDYSLVGMKIAGNLIPCFEKYFQLSDVLHNATVATNFRHPSILCIHRAFPDPLSNCIFMLAEPCLPLSTILHSLTFNDVLLGFRSLLSAMSFLHNRLSLSHNNIRCSSVFVTNRSKWKLSAFEFSLGFNKMTKEVLELIECFHKEANPEAYVFHVDYPFCYDVLCFARMAIVIITQCTDTSFTGLSNFTSVLRNSCMHVQPQLRLPAAQLFLHPVFRNPLVQSVNFFENYMSYSDSEKEAFFGEFQTNVIDQLSSEEICKILLPICFERNIFLDPPSQPLIVQIFHPQPDTTFPTSRANPANDLERSTCVIHPFLSYSVFRKYVTPWVLGKFRVHERHSRMLLLEHFANYYHLIPLSDLHNTLLPEVCLGLFDYHDRLSTLSLCALGELSTLLGPTVTLNELKKTESELRHITPLTTSNQAWPRWRLFAEAGPKISARERAIPFSEQHKSDKTNRWLLDRSACEEGNMSLAELADLSANHIPNVNSLLEASEVPDLVCQDKDSIDSHFAFKGNAKRISTHLIPQFAEQNGQPPNLFNESVCLPSDNVLSCVTLIPNEAFVESDASHLPQSESEPNGMKSNVVPEPPVSADPNRSIMSFTESESSPPIPITNSDLTNAPVLASSENTLRMLSVVDDEDNSSDGDGADVEPGWDDTWDFDP